MFSSRKRIFGHGCNVRPVFVALRYSSLRVREATLFLRSKIRGGSINLYDGGSLGVTVDCYDLTPVHEVCVNRSQLHKTVLSR